MVLDEEVPLSVSVSVLVPEVDGYELLPAPEVVEPLLELPALEPIVSDDGEDDDGERLPLDWELLLSVSRELLFDHVVNSDCDSAPSLFESAVVNAPLSSACIAASVGERRPSRFASSVENEAAPTPWLELLDPIELLLCPDVVVPWLELLLLGVDELLCP